MSQASDDSAALAYAEPEPQTRLISVLSQALITEVRARTGGDLSLVSLNCELVDSDTLLRTGDTSGTVEVAVDLDRQTRSLVFASAQARAEPGGQLLANASAVFRVWAPNATANTQRGL